MTRLGYVAQKFESGNQGPGCISNGTGDPGGKSYGIYQFNEAVAHTYWYASLLPIPLFNDAAWKTLADKYPIEFLLDQHSYAVRHYYSANGVFAKNLGYNTSLVVIQEAIFSAAIQHGGVQTILKAAALGNVDPVLQVQKLYDSRVEYVKRIGLSERLVKALLDRYSVELLYVLETSPELVREFA